MPTLLQGKIKPVIDEYTFPGQPLLNRHQFTVPVLALSVLLILNADLNVEMNTQHAHKLLHVHTHTHV